MWSTRPEGCNCSRFWGGSGKRWYLLGARPEVLVNSQFAAHSGREWSRGPDTRQAVGSSPAKSPNTEAWMRGEGGGPVIHVLNKRYCSNVPCVFLDYCPVWWGHKRIKLGGSELCWDEENFQTWWNVSDSLKETNEKIPAEYGRHERRWLQKWVTVEYWKPGSRSQGVHSGVLMVFWRSNGVPLVFCWCSAGVLLVF